MRASTRLTIATVATSALLLTAGCGGTSSGPESNPLALMAKNVAETVRKAASKTDEVTSVRVTMTGTAEGEKIDIRGALVFDTPVRAEFTTFDDGQEMTFRIVGPVFYIKMPDDQRADMGGKTWMKMDLSKSRDNKQGLDLAKQFEDLDPRTQVRSLLDNDAVTAVGQEEINGVKTVHYSGTASIEDYLEQVDSKYRDDFKKTLSSQGITEVKIDLWIDEDYRPRRVRTVMGNTDMTADYTDYGGSVTVEEPPASDVADFNDLLKGLENLSNELGQLKLD